MKYFIVFRIEDEGGGSDDVFEVNDVLYEIMHDTLKAVVEEHPMLKEKS